MNKQKIFSIAAAFAVLSAITLNPFTAYAKVSLPDNLHEHYEKQPETIRQIFDEDGWDLEVVSGNELNYLYGQGSFYENGYDISGVTVYDIKTIYLSDSPGYAEVSLNHEMGHFLDYSYYTYFGVQPSKTDEFYYIYTQESAPSYLYEDYELSDISEYFAQSYWSYVEEKEDFALFYPMTYQYLDNVILDYEAAVDNGFNRIYDGKVFMMHGRRIDSTPYSNMQGTQYSESTKKINTRKIPLLKGYLGGSVRTGFSCRCRGHATGLNRTVGQFKSKPCPYE